MVSPNASDRRRSWPLENFLRAARQVATQHELAVVLIGDEKNHFPIRWPDDTGANPDLIDLSGQIPTEDLPDALARAELVISNDSGTYHLGVSLDRPTIAVGGSGLPARYFPYPSEATLLTKVLYRPVPCAGCNWRCIHTTSRSETAWCMQQVSWPEMADAADELLRRSPESCNRLIIVSAFSWPSAFTSRTGAEHPSGCEITRCGLWIADMTCAWPANGRRPPLPEPLHLADLASIPAHKEFLETRDRPAKPGE